MRGWQPTTLSRNANIRSGGFFALEPLPSWSEIMNRSRKPRCRRTASGRLARRRRDSAIHPAAFVVFGFPRKSRGGGALDASPASTPTQFTSGTLESIRRGDAKLPPIRGALETGGNVVRIFVAEEEHPFLIALIEQISAPQRD